MLQPDMNIDFDPPGRNLPHYLRWSRHIEFDHYRPVAESGAVMVARSTEDVRRIILLALAQPGADSQARTNFIKQMFNGTLDGGSGERVTRCLLNLAASNGPLDPQS